MKEYYIWNVADTAKAQAALDFINGDKRLPLIGKNVKTKQLEPTKQKAIRWVKKLTVFQNGTVGFPFLTNAIMDEMGITDTEKMSFMMTYQPIILPFEDSWLPPKPTKSSTTSTTTLSG